MPVKSLPHSEEAEQGVLGSMMLSKKCAINVIQRLNSDYFYIPANSTIFNSMIDAMDGGMELDLITFTQFLKDKGVLEAIGGHKYITYLYTFVPTAANIDHYVSIVKEKYILRQVIETCEELTKKCGDESENADALLCRAQSKLLDLSVRDGAGATTIKEYVFSALDEISSAIEHKGKISGLSTGLIDLDRKLGGLKPQQMMVIAADTSQGKTALALNIAEHLAIQESIPVGIISLEMSGEELTQRLIASYGRINLHNLFVSGVGVGFDYNVIVKPGHKIAESPLIIRDEADLDFAQMRAIGREMRQSQKVKMIILDYVQLLVPGNTKDENRERAMSSAAQACKQMAKELECVVVVLSQVNEQGKLRESKAIGHHADKVILITHDFEEPGTCYADVVKNRQGPTGRVKLTFLRDYARFESAARL